MSDRSAVITGTGIGVPERVLTNQDLERMVDTSDDWIVTRTGIRERRIAGDGDSLSQYCVEASKRAFEAAGISPRLATIAVTMMTSSAVPRCRHQVLRTSHSHSTTFVPRIARMKSGWVKSLVGRADNSVTLSRLTKLTGKASERRTGRRQFKRVQRSRRAL